MIARVLGAGITIAVYLGAATLMAEVILGGYLCIAWNMDRGRAIQMLAIAQGIDLFAASRSHGPDEDDAGPEQPSLEQLIDARTAKDLDITIREQALQNSSNHLAALQRQLAEEQESFQQTKKAYETQLQELMEGERVAGRDNNRLILETLKASQAKKLLSLMLENDELDEVVLLLADMTSRPQAKIFAEFKTPEDEKQLGEILRMIRQGRPAVTLAEQTAGELADIQKGGNP